MILRIGIGKQNTFSNNLKHLKYYEKAFSYFGSCSLWY